MIRKANIDEPEQIAKLINGFAEQQMMLARSLNEVYESLRDFLVYEEDGRLVGCAALHVAWGGLAEIRSLAVRPEAQRRGIGTGLVKACIDEARDMRIKRVFVLTYMPPFFERLGFSRYPKEQLPHKIWTDCLRCPHFPNCDEEALILELEPSSENEEA